MSELKNTNLFIEVLKKRNSNYSDPYQSLNQYNSLTQLSSGIYTEEERFIYELLQNADDAARNSKLKVRIDIGQNHLAFSHNGDPFDEIDVESICSVGDGGKSNDKNKTGYKGIGFKSVFSHSHNVVIKTGSYCFKFSEKDWINYWSQTWGNLEDWQHERRSRSKSAEVKMPWQIIPIPFELENSTIDFGYLADYHVSTILFDLKSDKLIDRVLHLLSDSQILLFLRSNDVILEVYVYDQIRLSIKKELGPDSVGLYSNNVLKSEWLVRTKELLIPEEVMDDIGKDDKTPPKLKGASSCEVSFAIQKEKSKFIQTDDSLIYTYLPTSVSCGFPFVVNANFLTDSGRQQLQKESKWNLWIFSQIASSFLEWIAELWITRCLDKSFLTVIPERLSFGELGIEFNNGYEKALREIEFIPNNSGGLIRVDEAVFDRTGLSKLLSEGIVLDFINAKYNANYDYRAFIPDFNNIRKLKALGVRVFGLEELNDFFNSESFQSNHSLSENFRLLCYLYDYVQNIKSPEEKKEWNERLKTIAFIFDEKGTLKRPEHIYFPSVSYSNEFTDDISVIHSEVIYEINKNAEVRNWLESLGVKEPTDLNFIEKSIIGDSSFITVDNVIEVGQYLFNAYKKGMLDDEHLSDLRKVNVLTQQYSLKKAEDCFLSNLYDPELKLENVYVADIYVSQNYFEEKDLISEWKTFFLKIGIKNDIEWTNQAVDLYYNQNWKSRSDKKFFEIVEEFSDKFYWIAWAGWSTKSGDYPFNPSSIYFEGFSFMQFAVEYQFSKIFFNLIFKNFSPSKIDIDNEIRVVGSTGFINRVLTGYDLRPHDCPTRHFRWVMENIPMIPTINGDVLLAENVFLNTSENLNFAGKYLPIIDVETEISDEWLEYVPLRRYFNLEDYLDILTQVSNDLDGVEKNKSRILSIYKLLSNSYLYKKNELSTWGNNNKLLCINNEFIAPNELKYYTKKGFLSDDLIFSDANDLTEELLSLFELFGVTIIQDFKPEIVNPQPNPSLKIRLQEVLPYLLLIVEKRNAIDFSQSYEDLSNRIDEFEFIEAVDIFLSFESNGALVKGGSVRSYLSDYALTYRGKWSNPLTLFALVPDISKLLEVKDLNEVMKVILLSDISEINIFLDELGINSSEASTRKEFNMSVARVESYSSDDDEIEPSENLLDFSDERSRLIISAEAKLKIFEDLKANGYCIPDTCDIKYTVVKGVTRPDGTPVTLVVKSGKGGNLYFNPSEWLALSGSDVQLFVVSRGNIVRNVTMDDLLEYNENFHMRFNTQAFAVDTNLKVFAKFFQYLKYTHFIFDTPENTNDYLQEFGLNERNRSAIDLTSDDKNLLL